MKASITAVNKIDSINVILIIVSLLLSFLLPFRLFLFSYAILGPLHYMTEINWLNEKNYFIKDRRWIWFFISLSLLVSVPVMSNLSIFSFNSAPEILKDLILGLASQTDLILLTMILFAVGVVFLKKWTHVVLFLALSLLLSKLITRYVLGSYILVGIFLPTIIHVYLFTFFFMLLGALNSNSRLGWIGLLLLGLCPVIIMFSEITPALYKITESSTSIATAQNFRFINYIAGCFNASENERIVSLSATGIKIQTFVAFCYTYHYLNWFSKVSVIGWKKNISGAKLIITLIAWVGAIALFIYNYEIAYLALFFLTILHIVLEFPLNVVCIKEIFLKLKLNLQ